MLDSVREQFEQLKKLSSVELNRVLVQSLNHNDSICKESKIKHEIALCKKSGDLESAYRILNSQIGTEEIERSPNQKIMHFQREVDDQGFQEAPLVIIDGFLRQDENRRLLTFALEQKNKFVLAGFGYKKREIDIRKRSTLALFSIGSTKDVFHDFIRNNMNWLCGALNIETFTIDKISTKITNHVDGGFFNIHKDTNVGIEESNHRSISWLYYFHQSPKRFQGGELFLFDTHLESDSFKEKSFIKVNPNNNRLVLFPSQFYHGVMETRVPSRAFEDGRLAVSGHVLYT